MSRSLAAFAATTMAAALLSVTAPAEAATYSSSGQRCTKVGTARADRLVGTSRNDVICGRGGNDVITGGGGNDVIDGGSGADRVDAGTGNDRVYAGSGRDVVTGSSGDDRLVGGDDDDTIEGSPGDDALFGGTGDDDLLGGTGSDDVDGGAGTNYCDEPSEDRQTACTVDQEAPRILEVRPDRSSVDVSTAAQVVTVMVHAVDDTGILVVTLEATSHDGANRLLASSRTRTSGTPRDGWWRVRLEVPRFLPSATWDLQASLQDRLMRAGGAEVTPELTVVDDHPDLAAPVVRSFAATRTRVDVRQAPASLAVRTRITDDASGVHDVLACAEPLTDQGYGQGTDHCWGTPRTSGTATDSFWDIHFEMSRRAPSGTYAFRICTSDRAHTDRTTCWISQAEADYRRSRGWPVTAPLLPGGGGTLEVVGLGEDVNAPVLGTVTVSPAVVDASAGARRAYVYVRATDVEGLDQGDILVSVYHEDGRTVLQSRYWAFPHEGTPQDGTWRVPLDVLGGTPPGRYVVEVTLRDRAHETTYAPADHLIGTGWVAFTSGQATNGGYLVVR
ncbi:Hemolysin-type calcium-binding repeat-containing protein [Nocardioides scoriae]|uniref:Hemolysin-type calcium-binding repeat-containing protein n=1 Tax=Nocardioides scoriae TaxID=642780 RepID=A0A1H1UTL7_9ACTN|nr:hypothetical protein [Nocardioides scoriae]SDS75892.1 Hemolysin-type calcium-binding repeat-containing protein [Nocardioides scoriae]